MVRGERLTSLGRARKPVELHYKRFSYVLISFEQFGSHAGVHITIFETAKKSNRNSIHTRRFGKHSCGVQPFESLIERFQDSRIYLEPRT
jgi:hypothetical protein